MKIFSRAAKLFQKNGWRKLRRRVGIERRQEKESENFQKWIIVNRLTDAKRESMRREIKAFSRQIKISVLLPVYNVEEKWLRLCIESVTNQIYENWELCIADDCSPSPHIREILEEYVAKDKRVKVVFRSENGHISAASNSALKLATGEFTGLLDHDDEISEDALFQIAREINQFPDANFIYTDEDMIDETGARYEPKFKPDFSRDFLYSVNYITHFAVYRTEMLRRVGGFRIGAEGSQDYDLALRVIEEISEMTIRHIPKILYHWRAIRGSVAFSSDEKPYAHERARQAIREHFERVGKHAAVSETVYNLHRVCYELPKNAPKISLIFSAGEDFSEKTVEDFVGQIDYENYEIVIAGNFGAGSQANLTNVKFVDCESESEAEQLNFAAAQTSGEILCFADLNLKSLAKDWLTELARFVWQKEIGAVGAKILDADESIRHAGLIVGAGDLTSAVYENFPRGFGGMLGRAQLAGNYSAVSISCFATRRAVFDSVGGFDAKAFPNRLFDADFCLKLREKNYRIVYTPSAELIKIDAKRRLNLEKKSTAEEKNRFIEKWKKIVESDPFYNPNLSKRDANFSIEI